MSDLSELRDRDLLSGGNAVSDTTSIWNHVDLEHMAEQAGFKNQKTTKLAVLECVDPETPADERRMELYDLVAGHYQD